MKMCQEDVPTYSLKLNLVQKKKKKKTLTKRNESKELSIKNYVIIAL